MGSWRWSSSASASATAINPFYCPCPCHVPLSLNNFSFSTPSLSSSKISPGIKSKHQLQYYNNNNNVKNRKRCIGFDAAKNIIVKCTTNTELEEQEEEEEQVVAPLDENSEGIAQLVWEWAVLISPFFFWGTAMVAMKEVIPKYGPFFVSAFRTIPAGFLLVAFAASRARPFPSGLTAWLSISLFALVDAACFQVTIFTFLDNSLLPNWFGGISSHQLHDKKIKP